MGEAYSSFWTRYTDFSGRSSRLEFWVPYLINAVVMGVLNTLGGNGSHWFSSPFKLAAVVFGLAILVPTLALIPRRVRDTGVKNVVLWAVLSIIFQIVALFFGIIDKNHYGRR